MEESCFLTKCELLERDGEQRKQLRMKIQYFSVLDTSGKFFEGEIPGTVCFVPDSLVTEGRLDQGHYVLQGWASLNIKAQTEHLGIGSHLFPNLCKPFNDKIICDKIKARMTQLRPKALIAER
jgi:hypothetical protein